MSPLNLLLVLLIGILATSENLAHKHILKKLKPLELIVGISFVNFVNLVFLLILSGKFFPVVSGLKRKFTLSILISLILFSCIIFIGDYSLSYLAIKEEVSEYIPILAISSTILTFFGGVFFFNEKAIVKDYIALMLMVGGIFLMAY